jgi:hypothetical protein
VFVVDIIGLLIGLFLALIFFTFYFHVMMFSEFDSSLKKRTRKRLLRKLTFLDWLLCRRYYGIVSNFKIFWYFANFALYLICSILIIVVNEAEFGRDVFWCYYAPNGCLFIFWTIEQLGDRKK